VLAAGISGARAQEDRPGQCPAFSAAEIDNCFTAWKDETDYDPIAFPPLCRDDPTTPRTLMFVDIPEGTFFTDVVPTGTGSFLARLNPRVGDTFVCPAPNKTTSRPPNVTSVAPKSYAASPGDSIVRRPSARRTNLAQM
jgi:hypothetical protein